MSFRAEARNVAPGTWHDGINVYNYYSPKPLAAPIFAGHFSKIRLQ